MNTHEYEQLLADALAGELSLDERTRLEAALAADPQRAQEFADLVQVRDLLQTAPVPSPEATTQARTHATPRVIPFHRRALGVLRYAAVALLAFSIGFAVRGGGAPPSDTAAGAARLAQDSIRAPLPIQAGGTLERQYANATSAFPASRSFTHALLSIARN